MPDKLIELLDPEAQKIFSKFKGIDTKLRVHSVSSELEDQHQLDQQRLLLIDLAFILGSYFKNVRFLEGVKTKDNFLRKALMELSSVFYKISQIPSYDGSVLIRFRGSPPGLNASAGIDYVAVCGRAEVDCGMTAGMFSRLGSSMSHLSARLAKSFEIFATHAINSLHLQIPGNSREELDQMVTSLHILGSYSHSMRSSTPIVYEHQGLKVILPLIQDETGKPDPNLTLLAGLNQLKPEAMKDLVRKVADWMKKADPAGIRFINVFNTIFEIKSLREKLIRPPLEMNNVRWILFDQNSPPPSPEKLQIVKLALNHSTSPQEEALMMNSVYGNDFHKINSEYLGQRINLASKLMDVIEKNGVNAEVEDEMLANVESRIGQVRDEILEDITIHQNDINIGFGEGQKIIPQVNSKLLNVLHLSKRRVASKVKMRGIAISSIFFNDQDYAALAKHFDIPIDDAKDLVDLLKSCFDANGRFRRQVFEKNIPIFAWYEEKIFDFMWHYLTHIAARNDRVAFLNAFKLLIDRMKQPLKAALMLLGDFLKDPFKVNYSDRNAIMLTNQLLRTYNKELKVDIELTPEEVLRVKAGINREALTGVSEFIDLEHERFMEKIRNIQKSALAALQSDQDTDENGVSFRYLFFLERELYIFLALLGGNISATVIRYGLKLYGNNSSPLRLAKNSDRHSMLLLQQLRILVRAIGRIGDKSDVQILDELKQNQEGNLHVSANSATAEAVRQLLKWIEGSRKSILEKEWG